MMGAVRTIAMACAVPAVALAAVTAHAEGEPVDGFPTWEERVLLEWTNRARCDPQVEMTECGSACADAACYSPVAPLGWSHELNRAARFHADEMVEQGYFGHDSHCTVVPNIDDLYPDSCDGSASCACVGGVEVCSPVCTEWDDRVHLFSASPRGEIIATGSDPDSVFYRWLYESTWDARCMFTIRNGHRWLILTATGAVGFGVSGHSVGDFGSGPAPSAIPSGAHYPRQASVVDAWANWYAGAGPLEAWVNVDGSCSPLSLERGSATNGAWTTAVSGVGSGCHRYYFEFLDSTGEPVRYPTNGSFAIAAAGVCPDWASTRPPSCLVTTGEIFADDFESGYVSAWSDVVGGP
jgi:hypothetical protein